MTQGFASTKNDRFLRYCISRKNANASKRGNERELSKNNLILVEFNRTMHTIGCHPERISFYSLSKWRKQNKIDNKQIRYISIQAICSCNKERYRLNFTFASCKSLSLVFYPTAKKDEQRVGIEMQGARRRRAWQPV